jgi:ABC-2 type transport system ATP-binding protein
MTAPAILAEGIVKRFGKVTALDGLDLVAESGHIVAILGPNGAGKTTFVRAVATLVRPDSGSLVVAGVDATEHPDEVRRVMSLAGQYAAVEPAMTGRENVAMVAQLVGFRRRAAQREADEVLERMGLSDAADRLARAYSGGMRRRLDLAASLVGAPRLLLLDEPTTGLDPRSRIDLWDAIRALVARGTDVLLTTQYLDEADHLADAISIIDHGRVIASGSPARLKAQAGNDVIELHARSIDDLDAIANGFDRLSGEAPIVDRDLRRISVTVDEGTERLRDAVRIIDDLGVAVDDIGLRRPTLDEVFLALTGAERSTKTARATDVPVAVSPH